MPRRQEHTREDPVRLSRQEFALCRQVERLKGDEAKAVKELARELRGTVELNKDSVREAWKNHLRDANQRYREQGGSEDDNRRSLAFARIYLHLEHAEKRGKMPIVRQEAEPPAPRSRAESNRKAFRLPKQQHHFVKRLVEMSESDLEPVRKRALALAKQVEPSLESVSSAWRQHLEDANARFRRTKTRDIADDQRSEAHALLWCLAAADLDRSRINTFKPGPLMLKAAAIDFAREDSKKRADKDARLLRKLDETLSKDASNELSDRVRQGAIEFLEATPEVTKEDLRQALSELRERPNSATFYRAGLLRVAQRALETERLLSQAPKRALDGVVVAELELIYEKLSPESLRREIAIAHLQGVPDLPERIEVLQRRGRQGHDEAAELAMELTRDL